jgi:hypothetical protein
VAQEFRPCAGYTQWGPNCRRVEIELWGNQPPAIGSNMIARKLGALRKTEQRPVAGLSPSQPSS